MAKTEITVGQVQLAAQAGADLLKTDDLPVPMKIAKNGILGVLEGVLQALAAGEVILMHVPQEMKAPQTPAGEPNKEVADAVAAAVDSSGNSGDAPDAEQAEG